MTSGKASKRKRREAKVPPPPPVKGARGGRRASPKVVIAAAAVIVVVAIGAGLAFALGGGGSSSPGSSTPTRGSVKNGLPGSAEVAGLFRGIPQHGTVLGSPSAPVSIVEYVDLQCPACQQFETQALPQLLSRYVRPGKVKLEARPIAFIGPDSEVGRAAALAAAAQNRMFNFMEILYSNQGTENTGWLTSDMVKAAAGSIPGLDVPLLLSGSAGVKDQEDAIDTQEKADGVNSTPTLLVGRNGGKLHEVSVSSLTDIQSLSTAIDAALR